MKRALIVVAFAAACAAPMPAPDRPGAADAYRAELLRHPGGPRAHEARQRLEVAQFEAARRAHTVLAWRHYLEEFADGAHAAEARALLEGLRWADVERAPSEARLRGYLADEPSGAHAKEAWTRLTSLRLEAALVDGSAGALRAFAAENPTAAGGARVLAALDEAEYREARNADGLRRYLSSHPEGAHAREAAARVEQAEVAEAALLEDVPRLTALAAAPGASQELARDALTALACRTASEELDEGRLSQLARKPAGCASQAARALAELRRNPHRAGELERAASRLHLPAPTLDELPLAPAQRIAALRKWAEAGAGRRLGRIVAELSHGRADVSLAALESAQALASRLPREELRLRAERLVEALRPTAQDAPRLAQLALLERVAGRTDAALADARAAASRDARSLVAAQLLAELEAEQGEPAVAALAAQALALSAREAGEVHAGAAAGLVADPLALGELCAARTASARAAALVKAARVAAAPELVAAVATIDAGLLGRLAEREAAAPPGFVACERARLAASDAHARAVAERVQAARALSTARDALAGPALARARARDPERAVREAAGAPRTRPSGSTRASAQLR